MALPEPTHVIASAPYFSLSAPYTQTVLVACRDHPIQLYYALPEEGPPASPAPSVGVRPPPVSSYPLIKPQTEEYLTPTALLWSSPGTHFLTGTANLVSYFDITRTGSGPLHRIATIPSTRHLAKGGGVGMRGTVSALAAQPDSGLVAAGTWTRWVGLYDLARGGECAATWSVAEAADRAVGGKGILQTIWSPCGRYLVINERKSTGLLVYDVRVTGQVLGWLAGRAADTHQRLTCDVDTGVAESGGFEVWAGTQDGTVVVWEGVGDREGAVERSWDWQAHDPAAAVGSTAMHSSGSVVATCSGSWSIPDGDEDSMVKTTSNDASLRIWSLGAGHVEDADPEAR